MNIRPRVLLINLAVSVDESPTCIPANNGHLTYPHGRRDNESAERCFVTIRRAAFAQPTAIKTLRRGTADRHVRKCKNVAFLDGKKRTATITIFVSAERA